MSILCVAASPSVDKLFEVERVEVGEIHRPDAFVQVPGGKGLNCARAAAALGAEVTATGILGGFAGRWIEQALVKEGVRGRFAWVEDMETRASLSVADRATGRLTEFYEKGWAIGIEGWWKMEAVVGELLPGKTWMTVSGYLPVGAPDDGYARLVRMAGGRGVRVALDARDEALARGIAEGPAVVKVNAEEAGTLLRVDVRDRQDALAAAHEVRARCGGAGHAAIVTLGAEGAVVVTPDGSALTCHLYAKGLYPVGSGDAFLGGLVTGLDGGNAWPDALRLALGAATANAMQPGAGRLDAAKTRELAQQAEVVPLQG